MRPGIEPTILDLSSHSGAYDLSATATPRIPARKNSTFFGNFILKHLAICQSGKTSNVYSAVVLTGL